ncbi:unnamed protein product [Rangifer tarandus platyrhynchus]|uniref:Uncharacterized protein n=2 Tax=Rangifer tarandus platyrhynchus TaxID=3082113 RepID=A0ACB0ETA8_RANTA|nr:unnamed protein product [Rangifer tarandus platyrhynchus]CAI9703930.1 unnamed protein product [Rangifer tarandus platyrhynchus]
MRTLCSCTEQALLFTASHGCRPQAPGFHKRSVRIPWPWLVGSRAHVPCTARQRLRHWAARKAKTSTS